MPRRPGIDVSADPAAALRLIDGRDVWPMQPTCYGRSPLPVAFWLGGDCEVFFTPDSLRSLVLYSRRACAAAGSESVAADMPPPGLADAYRRRYGDFAAHYELERWYAPFGGARRRILVALLPSRAECEALCPEAPPVVVARLEDLARQRPAAPLAATPRPARRAAAGQGSLF